jgi:hypothetical protein
MLISQVFHIKKLQKKILEYSLKCKKCILISNSISKKRCLQLKDFIKVLEISAKGVYTKNLFHFLKKASDWISEIN